MKNTKSLRKTTTIPLLLFIALLFLLWRGLYLDPRFIPSPLIGKPLPAFAPSKPWEGHPALIHVFATWCETCAVEHPLLMDIAKQHRVAIYGIDYKDDASALRHWLQLHGNPYQKVWFDSDGHLGLQLGVYGTPETFLIDSQGIVRARWVGALTQTLWEKQIIPMLAKPK